MKAQISKKVITYSMVAAMLLTQSASAAGSITDFFKKEAEITVPSVHPCARELQLELDQIKIMESTQDVINSDSKLRVGFGTAAAAMEGQDAVSEALKGNLLEAGLSAISAAIYAKRAIDEGKKDIKTHFTLAEGIQERKANLKYVLANPNVCNEAVRKIFLTTFLAETIERNKSYVAVLDAGVNKMEGKLTPIQNKVSLGVGLALAAGTVIAFNSKAPPLAVGILGVGSFLGLGTGVIGFAKDYFHNIPTLNELNAQKSELEKINNQFQYQLSLLKQASN